MSVYVFSESRLMAGRLCLLFLCFVVPLVFSTRLEDGFELPQFLCAAIAVSFLLLLCRAADGARAFKANWFLFLFVFAFWGTGFYSFAGLIREADYYFPAQNFLWVLTPVLFLTPVGLYLGKRKLYSFLVLAGVLGSFYSLAQTVGLDAAGWNTHFGGRSFSTLGNPTFWAGQLLVILPLSVYLVLTSERNRAKYFWLGAVGLLTASLLATQTRGAWLGFLGEVVVLVVLTRRRGQVWKWMMLGMIAFLFVLLAVPSLNMRALSLFKIHDRDAQGRYFLWKAAVSQWKEKKWMGQGPGGYAYHFTRTQAQLSELEPFRPYWTATHAHEEYLELLAERGIVGALLALILLGILVGRRLKKDESSVFSFGTSELAVLSGIGIHALFHFPFSVVPTACSLALLFNPSWDQKAVPSLKEKPLWNELRLFWGIGLFVFCGLGMKLLTQNIKLHQAIDLTSGQNYEEALKLLDGDSSPRLFHYLDPRVLKQKALVLAALGREAEAVALWEEVVHAYPYDADGYAMLCMFYGKQPDWERAMKNGGMALEISPCHEQALNNLAMVYYLEGRKKEALPLLERLEQAQRAWGREDKAAETRQKIKALESIKGASKKQGLP